MKVLIKSSLLGDALWTKANRHNCHVIKGFSLSLPFHTASPSAFSWPIPRESSRPKRFVHKS